ncbi:N-acetylglucosamine-6-phosphate deacetylase [Mycoplasma corogypsi]|uniref:N-acetylglucosamine-6-phosphate deacetylase n=1 Tax=Mycoplasma corogypsi TaxID=2106 RepID=UPI003872B697
MIIKNVKIVNFDQTINNADIEIEGKLIKNIVIHKEGMGSRTIVPGFIDTHIHGFADYDVMEGSLAVEKISYQLAKHGTTSFMPTAMTNKWETILVALKNIAQTKNFTSKNLGIHIEGPYIGLEKKGAHKPEYLIKATKENVEELFLASQKQLKKISFDPNMASIEIQNKMFELGIIPSIGHSPALYEEAKKFFDNGCYSVCHLWNAMSGVDSRKPGIVQAALMDQKVYTEVIVDLHHIVNQTIDFTIKNKGIDKIICISDAIKPAYSADGDSISGDIPITKKRHRNLP